MITSHSRALKTFSSFPPKKITEGLYGDNRSGSSDLFRHSFLEDFLQGFLAATTQLREQLSVIEEIPAQDFGYAEDEMAMGFSLKEFTAILLHKKRAFNRPSLIR